MAASKVASSCTPGIRQSPASGSLSLSGDIDLHP